MRRFALALAAISAMGIAAPALAATQTINGSSQLTGATGVTVGGSTYTVTFLDGTCAGLFGGCDAVSDFTFHTQADAQAAAAALLAQVIVGSSFDTAPGTTFGCIGGASCSMIIPYGLDGERVGFFDAATALNAAAFNSTAISLSGSPTAFDTTGNTGSVFALFTLSAAAVPEPSAWAMMLLGFASIGMALRRRRLFAAA